MLKKLGLGCLLVAVLQACTSNVDEYSDIVEIKAGSHNKSLVPADKQSGMQAYASDKKSFQAEWISCGIKSPVGLVYMVNTDAEAWNKDSFCQGWAAQAFLNGQYQVVGINLPGYGQSTGEKDGAGLQSAQAVAAVLRGGKQFGADKVNAVGIWGYGLNGIAAAMGSKTAKSGTWLMLGNTVYDAEVTVRDAKDPKIAAALQQRVKAENDAAFERRSIAWDFDGLPKRVIMYHGNTNVAVPVQQVKTFRDTIAGQEYHAELMLLENSGQDLPNDLHASVLHKIIATQLTGPE